MDDRHYEASPLARMSTIAAAAALAALFFGEPDTNPADTPSAAPVTSQVSVAPATAAVQVSR